MAEVLVTLAVFSGLVMLTLAIHGMSLRSASKSEAESGAYREALVALGYLEEELRGARLTAVRLDDLRFRKPVLEEGLPLLAPSGDFVYPPRECVLTVDAENRLVLLQPGLPARILARLGERGGINFQAVTETLLRVYLRCHHRLERGGARPDQESFFDVTREFRMPNQPR